MCKSSFDAFGVVVVIKKGITKKVVIDKLIKP